MIATVIHDSLFFFAATFYNDVQAWVYKAFISTSSCSSCSEPMLDEQQCAYHFLFSPSLSLINMRIFFIKRKTPPKPWNQILEAGIN